MLTDEETTLDIFKERLRVMSQTNRWYAVLLRYMGLLSARVNGIGGDANSVPASFGGYYTIGAIRGDECVEFTGKVCQVIFDCFGDSPASFFAHAPRTNGSTLASGRFATSFCAPARSG